MQQRNCSALAKPQRTEKVKEYGFATGTGVAFCPNCGRRLARHNLTMAVTSTTSLNC